MNAIFHDNKQLVSCHVQPKAGGGTLCKTNCSPFAICEQLIKLRNRSKHEA